MDILWLLNDKRAATEPESGRRECQEEDSSAGEEEEMGQSSRDQHQLRSRRQPPTAGMSRR